MPSRAFIIRVTYTLVIILAIAVTAGILVIVSSKIQVFNQIEKQNTQTTEIEPFPVSVNPTTQTITEDPLVNTFFSETIAHAAEPKTSWWSQITAVFSGEDWYQNLASPVSRIIVIWPGERKEELTKNIGDILRWDKEDRDEFIRLIDQSEPLMTEGKYFPGQYVTHRKATPEDVHQLVYNQFETEILDRYTSEVEAKVSLETALTIASLLEREASDFTNMREVSGVIWNRLFIDMPLQLDASLQYVKGSNPYEPAWWPAVRPKDKFQDSPYNTYQNNGLPPTPISNVSAESVLAALNPIETECLYYFHTNTGEYHCFEDYQGHVSKLKELYGRGK